MKKIIRLKVKELRKAQIDMEIPNNATLAEMMGVSSTQIWRVKLAPEDVRYNAPGIHFIAGVIDVFGGPFERFFYLDEGEESYAKQNNSS